jgi:glycosyltransferase involved in cell wall biosynthesis
MAELTKLSICIATYNRGKFISETLDSILRQMEPGVELLVVDGASPDNTSQVMARYVTSHPEIRYYREQENSGVDRDYDKAVGYATGEYCWLMTDDDLLHSGAVKKVLAAIESKVDLVIVNAEVRNADLSEQMQEGLLKFATDKEYKGKDQENFFVETVGYLSFIGCVVIKRELWLSRNRSSYYGTLFIHVGVIFQSPLIESARVIAEPLIIIRYGNAMWTSRSFEIWMFKWPQLIWSFNGFSDRAKQAVCQREPWRRTKMLFTYRAKGAYSLAEFHQFLSGRSKGVARIMAFLVAACPGALVNLIVVFYYALRYRSDHMMFHDLLRSQHASAASHFLYRVLLRKHALNLK